MTVLNDLSHDPRVRREATTLAKAGHNVVVLGIEGPGLPQQERTRGFTIMRLPMHSSSWPSSALSLGIKFVEYFSRTVAAATAVDADVYHAHDVDTLLVGAAAARVRKAQLLYDAHEFEAGRDWSRSTVPTLFQRLWTLPEQIAIRRAKVVITVSDSIADKLNELYDIGRPFVVRNIPETNRFNRFVDLRSQVGADQNTALVLYQGKISRGRGIEQSVRAVRQVRGAELVLVGDGPFLEPLRQSLARRGLQHKVHLIGRVGLDEVVGYTHAAEIGVPAIQNSCLNHYYCLPNKLFEYIQAGLPVVVSDFPEMARIVKEHEVGELVDPSSPHQIAAAIKRLVNDVSYYRTLKRNVIAASELFTWEKESNRLLRVYEELENSSR
ncbi:MAG: glycosyltransferase family 4 protein [bacterium]